MLVARTTALLRAAGVHVRSMASAPGASSIPATVSGGKADLQRALPAPTAQRFRGKTAVVTGSAMGIGLTVARSLAMEGARVILVDARDCADGAALIGSEGGEVAGLLQCDITDEASVVRMGLAVGELAGEGGLDVLVNNAGYNGECSLVRDASKADWELTLGINLVGTMMVTRELIPHLEAGAAPGNIVNVASNVARRGLPQRGGYVASKWGLIGLTQTLALELADAGVRANSVCPGPVEGERIEQVMGMHMEAEGVADYRAMRGGWEGVPLGRFARPDEVANAIKFLASDDASFCTGQAINVTGGFIMT